MATEDLFRRFVRYSEPGDRSLYLTSVGYSLFHLYLMWSAFAHHGHAPPYAFVTAHMVFVGVLYTLPKEIQRWQRVPKPPTTKPKAGHLLVFLWFWSFVAMGLGEHAWGESGYRIPDGMTEMTCFLVAGLGLTNMSKRRHLDKHAKRTPDEPSA